VIATDSIFEVFIIASQQVNCCYLPILFGFEETKGNYRFLFLSTLEDSKPKSI
jgi:hypothetical protein